MNRPAPAILLVIHIIEDEEDRKWRYNPARTGRSRALFNIPTPPSWIPAFACLPQAGRNDVLLILYFVLMFQIC